MPLNHEQALPLGALYWIANLNVILRQESCFIAASSTQPWKLCDPVCKKTVCREWEKRLNLNFKHSIAKFFLYSSSFFFFSFSLPSHFSLSSFPFFLFLFPFPLFPFPFSFLTHSAGALAQDSRADETHLLLGCLLHLLWLFCSLANWTPVCCPKHLLLASSYSLGSQHLLFSCLTFFEATFPWCISFRFLGILLCFLFFLSWSLRSSPAETPGHRAKGYHFRW